MPSAILAAVLVLLQDPAPAAAPPTPAQAPAQAAPAQADLAFVGASVICGDRAAALDDHTVLVRQGRVIALGPRSQVAVPPGFATVAAAGLWLAPGLADAHGHPPDAEPDDAIGLEHYLLLNLAAGVTTLRSMRGTESQLAVRDRIARGELFGPRLLVAGMVLTATEAGAEAQVQDLARRGYDLVKLLGPVDVPAFRALARAAAARGLPFAGHVPAGVPVHELAAAGYGVEHLHGFLDLTHSDARLRELAQLSARAGIVHDPTSDFVRVTWQLEPAATLAARTGVDAMPKADRERWRRELAAHPVDAAAAARAQKLWSRRLVLLRELADAGATLLVSASHGPFVVPGHSMVEEMRVFLEAGLTPAQVFACATRGLAGSCRDPDLGLVRVGARASFVLLGRDPRADVQAWRDLRGVVADGRYASSATLAERLRAVARQ